MIDEKKLIKDILDGKDIRFAVHIDTTKPLANAFEDVLEEAFEKYRNGIINLVLNQPTIKAKKEQSLTDFVDTTIVKVRSEICDNYCKYTEECGEAMDQGKDYPCPLDRL